MAFGDASSISWLYALELLALFSSWSSLLSPIDKVTVSVVDGTQKGEDSSAPFIIPINFTSEGEYELVAKAIDKNGLTSNEETIKVTIVTGDTDSGQLGNSQPSASWKTPVQSETVSGNVILEVEDKSVRNTQIKRLKYLKETRNKIEVQKALTALTNAAKSGEENLLDLAIKAARKRATLGEISNALETVFGRQ